MIVIYLNNMLFIGRTKKSRKETITLQDVAILLFQCVGFVLKQKSVMNQKQLLEVFYKKVLLEISQNSQQNTCVRVSF